MLMGGSNSLTRRYSEVVRGFVTYFRLFSPKLAVIAGSA